MSERYLTDENYKMFSVKDKLPEGDYQYEYVLAYDFNRREYEVLYYLKDENRWETGTGTTFCASKITHWSYLPVIPENDIYETECTDDSCRFC